jgi:hypothetical protein
MISARSLGTIDAVEIAGADGGQGKLSASWSEPSQPGAASHPLLRPRSVNSMVTTLLGGYRPGVGRRGIETGRVGAQALLCLNFGRA